MKVFKDNGVTIEHIDLGGGLGVNYDDPEEYPDFVGYFQVFQKGLNLEKSMTLHFELGRSIINNCGSLITRVLYMKDNGHRKFLIVDGSMTELIRPALYGASHVVQNLTSFNSDK